jgi:hypothetical protein
VGAVRTGLTAAELRSEVRGLRQLDDRGRAARGWEATQDKLQNINDWREDLIRLTTYRTARKRMGPDEASAWVARHHFDYSDLTPIEQNVFRRIIPFYTFMARNTPLQVRNLAGRPGVFATEEKARMETAKAGEQNPQFARGLRKFEQVGVPWALPVTRSLNEYAPGRRDTGRNVAAPWAMYPKLPLMDISNIPLEAARGDVLGAGREAVQNVVGRSNPLIRLPIELGLGYNAFTRSTQDKDLVPAPSWAKHLEGTAAGNALGITKIKDPRTGKMVPGWRWEADAAVRTVPLTNRAASVGKTSKHGQPTDDVQLALSVLGPARWTQLDPRAVKINQNFENAAKLRRQIDTLKAQNPQLKKAGRNKDGSKSKRLEWTGKVRKEMDKLKRIEEDTWRLSTRIGASDPSGREPSKPKKRAKPKIAPIGGGAFGSGAFGSGGFGG